MLIFIKFTYSIIYKLGGHRGAAGVDGAAGCLLLQQLLVIGRSPADRNYASCTKNSPALDS
eukprot:SAG31_NODE_1500_length_8090_cov_10.522588_1_plen_61_part_00